MFHKKKTPVDRFITGDTQSPDTLLALLLESLCPRHQNFKPIEDTFNNKENAKIREALKNRPHQARIYHHHRTYGSPQHGHSYDRQIRHQVYVSNNASPKNRMSFRSRLPPVSVILFMSIYVIFLFVYIVFAVGGR